MKRKFLVYGVCLIGFIAVARGCMTAGSTSQPSQTQIVLGQSELSDVVTGRVEEQVDSAIQDTTTTLTNEAHDEARQYVQDGLNDLICARTAIIYQDAVNEAQSNNQSVERVLLTQLDTITVEAKRQARDQAIETYVVDANQIDGPRAYLIDSLAILDAIAAVKLEQMPSRCELTPGIVRSVDSYLDFAFLGLHPEVELPTTEEPEVASEDGGDE
ncbi:MAG: hypothetical protein AAF810_01335 [Cyanobacteria bacterium P01_D01_bin.36]